MALVPVLSFLLLLAFGSVDSWAACRNAWDGGVYGQVCYPYNSGCTCGATLAYNGQYWADCRLESGYYGQYCGCKRYCDNKRDLDSLDCDNGIDKYWDSALGECRDLVPDTTFFCENAGQVSSWTGGSPLRANVITCIDGSCNVTATLAGTCQDWGFCPEGVSSCEISKDSTGRRPCKRSGPETTSGTVCYYQCVDGRKLRCRPNSTQYVAGNIYVGTCPDRPSTSCDPPPNYSSSSVASSSGSSGTSSG